MRRRRLATPLAVLVLLSLGGCVAVSAPACPVCEQGAEHPLFFQESDRSDAQSTATVELRHDGTARWRVVNEYELHLGQELANESEIADRARNILNRSETGGDRVRDLEITIQEGNRVVIEYTAVGAVHTPASDVLVYDGFSVSDGHQGVDVNAETLTLRGPGDTVQTFPESDGIVRNGTISFGHPDSLDTDTIVLFGVDSGARGSLELRWALGHYHSRNLDRGLALSLLILLGATIAIISTRHERMRGRVVPDREAVRIAAAVALAGGLGVLTLGWLGGAMPVAGLATAYGLGAGGLVLTSRLGIQTRRSSAAGVAVGAIAVTAAIGAVATAMEGLAIPVGSSAFAPQTGLATPGAVALHLTVWSTLVAVPMGAGALGASTDRAVLRRGLAIGGLFGAVTLVWLWPVGAPISLPYLLVMGPLLAGFAAFVAIVPYGTGYHFHTHRSTPDTDASDASRSP